MERIFLEWRQRLRGNNCNSMPRRKSIYTPGYNHRVLRILYFFFFFLVYSTSKFHHRSLYRNLRAIYAGYSVIIDALLVSFHLFDHERWFILLMFYEHSCIFPIVTNLYYLYWLWLIYIICLNLALIFSTYSINNLHYIWLVLHLFVRLYEVYTTRLITIYRF